MKTLQFIVAVLGAVSMAHAAAPANDHFADRSVITSVPATITGTTIDATLEQNEPYAYSRSSPVWYEWTTATSGVLVVQITNCTNWAVCDIFIGTTLMNMTYRGSAGSFGPNNAEARVRVTNGVTCQLRVAAEQSAIGPRTESPFTLRLDLVPPPANDNFADRIVITSVPAAVSGATVDATLEPGEPSSLYQHSTVWYEWTAPTTGILRVRVTDSRSWMLARVFSGNAINQLSHVETVFSTVGGLPDEGNINVQEGVSYQFQVWADQPTTPPPSADGPFTLRLEYNAPPPNDHFTNRVRLQNAAERFGYRAVAATLEPGETQIGGGRSVWYQWRAPESGTVKVWCDGAVGVYSGTDEGRGALLTNNCYDVSFTSVAGQIYQLVFDDCGNPDFRHRPFNHVWTLSLNGASVLNLNQPANGTFNLNLYGDPSRSYTFEASTNLLHWTPTGAAIQNDATNFRQRFFRARVVE